MRNNSVNSSFLTFEMTLEAIKYKNGELKILDQLLLPAESRYIDINGVEEGWHAIHSMQVSKLK